jgi:lysophospholipase L1-like esterase/nicotinamidase-related amidase
MIRLPFSHFTALLLPLLAWSTIYAQEAAFLVVPQTRSAQGKALYVKENWLPSRTAVIVCDMWDAHHCKNAVTREKEMAPHMNQLLEKVRGMGVLVIHAPSGCMTPYEGTPARLRAKSAPAAARLPDKIGEWCKVIPAEERAVYPLDQSDGGEDDDTAEHDAWAKELTALGRNPRAPWTRQIDVLRIDQEKDAISDSGVEIWNLLEARGIDNVMLMGVHTNMCVAGRPFGLRQMAKNGKHVVLVRDLTDTMYNPKRWPFVSHVEGTERFIQHVEKHICPTISSDHILGGQPFQFSNATAGPRRTQIVLLGDSTTEASIPKKLLPDEPQFEDMIRMLLASEAGVPPCDVHNLGLSGEYIQRFLDSGRYDKTVPKLPQADFIFIRYGINDQNKRENYVTNFPKDYAALLSRLRKDHPKAQIVIMTTIPYGANNEVLVVNDLIRQVAAAEKLPLFDIAPRYLAELKNGPHMLNYRRYSLAKVPEALRPLAAPYVQAEAGDPKIVVLDNRLDGIFGHLTGWYGDRHPNLAGYHVIASETAKWLAPRMRGLK